MCGIPLNVALYVNMLFICHIFTLASNKLIKKVFPVPAGASRKSNFPSSLFPLCKILL